jgi:hypothetical protein
MAGHTKKAQVMCFYYEYYGWPMYWATHSGAYLFYPSIVPDHEKRREATQDENAWDPHLRSTYEVSGYHIQASVGDIGNVLDFIIDDETWAIRYLIVATQNWWSGKKVLVSPQWIERVSWRDSTVLINLTREAIRQSPEYMEESLLTRDYETGLHRHYDRQGYWVEDSAAKEHSR